MRELELDESKAGAHSGRPGDHRFYILAAAVSCVAVCTPCRRGVNLTRFHISYILYKP